MMIDLYDLQQAEEKGRWALLGKWSTQDACIVWLHKVAHQLKVIPRVVEQCIREHVYTGIRQQPSSSTTQHTHQ